MQQLITKFYTAFSNLDGEAMASCYHPDAIFNDEAFVNLKGKEPGLMWKMLLERSKGDLKISFDNVQASAQKGTADWVAEYVFSATGRKVINHIHAEFEFKDGLIYRHTDSFDLHQWAGQAMGLKGKLLGGFGFFRKKVQQTARLGLDKYIQKQG
jgi:ketosteroid isomerase-like protein